MKCERGNASISEIILLTFICILAFNAAGSLGASSAKSFDSASASLTTIAPLSPSPGNGGPNVDTVKGPSRPYNSSPNQTGKNGNKYFFQDSGENGTCGDRDACRGGGTVSTKKPQPDQDPPGGGGGQNDGSDSDNQQLNG